MEGKTVDFETNTEQIKKILNEGTEFEIYCKTKLNILNKLLCINNISRVTENTKRWSNLVKLPRFEISKFSGD